MVVSPGCARAQRFGKIPLRFLRYPLFRLNGACPSTSETSPAAKDFWSNLLNLERRLPELNEVVNENLEDLQGISLLTFKINVPILSAGKGVFSGLPIQTINSTNQ
jgi:hypothetical protein